MNIWYDDKANKQKVEDLEDTEAHEVLYNLTEDILCLKEEIAESEQKRVNLLNHIKGQKLWINLLRKSDHWISVKDRLPENEDYILLTDVSLHDYYGYLPVTGYYDLTDNKFFSMWDNKMPSTTHWQPLPEEPTT